jgi:1,4-dihydroxy-2-naphthoate octaprenyltransferase
LVASVLLVNAADLVILVVLAAVRGWPVVVFALVGFILSVAYTAPPLRLKKRGLGEPDVLVVWGPLMVGGTYYAAVGSITWQVMLASLPYALLCTSVLMGKHTDKIPYDAPLGIRTMPVLLGERRARAVTLALMAGFYLLIVVCVLVGALPWPALLALGGLFRLAAVWSWFRQPRPPQPPRPVPVWPLWFAALAFVHLRVAGPLLVLGLAIAALAGI